MKSAEESPSVVPGHGVEERVRGSLTPIQEHAHPLQTRRAIGRAERLEGRYGVALWSGGGEVTQCERDRPDRPQR